MFKPKEEPTFEEKVQNAISEYGQFVVDEVINAVELTDNVKGAYMMFLEFEQHQHVSVMKTIYGTIR
jgi:hypothetical protein